MASDATDALGRDPSDVRAARRSRRRDWVRKGGALTVASFLLLPLTALVAVSVTALFGAMDAGAGADWSNAVLWSVCTLVFGAFLALWFRFGMPHSIAPERYARVTAFAADRGWSETEAPDVEPFNRRVVAGQTGDSHRTIRYYAAAPCTVAPSAFVLGVSKHSGENQAKRREDRRRYAEIVHVIWTAPLATPVARAVVAAPADDPNSALEPFDTTARRFESSTFNGAYRVLSNDARVAHVVFDPALLNALLELRRNRVRLLWEVDVAYVACDLELLDDAMLARVPWLLERMQRNAALTA